jgi:N-ethylmaleimide reductase
VRFAAALVRRAKAFVSARSTDGATGMYKLSRRHFTRSVVASLSTAAVGHAGPLLHGAATPRLLEPLALGSLKLPNRVLMAPMTRGRAGESRTANELMAAYYAQRADAGLIVSEATAISPQGYGWIGSPAIYTDEHVAGWKRVTDAVHERGGRMFLQLWHMGRVSHPDFVGGLQPVGPSPVAAHGEAHTPLGKKPYVLPRAMTREDIAGTVRDYGRASARAREAGFDGVEIHAGYGYLIDQFIRDGSNRRRDEYGGPVGKRLRFLVEVTDAVSRAWPSYRVGVRVSPQVDFNDMNDSDPARTFVQLAKELHHFDPAYLHVIEYLPRGPGSSSELPVAAKMRAACPAPFILNGGYDAGRGEVALSSGNADAIAYGKWFLANPDLVERYRRGASLNKPDSSTYYSGGARGYTDYPPLDS